MPSEILEDNLGFPPLGHPSTIGGKKGSGGSGSGSGSGTGGTGGGDTQPSGQEPKSK